MDIRYVGLYVLSVLVAACSQILLKTAADKIYSSRLREYLNVPVIAGYGLMGVSLVMTMVAYRGVPLSYGPVIEALGYVFVAVLGWIFLKERLTGRKAAGMVLIIAGILLIQVTQ